MGSGAKFVVFGVINIIKSSDASLKLFAESAGCAKCLFLVIAGHLTKVCNAKEEAELLPALVVVYVYHCADLLCPQEVNCQEKHTLGHLNCLN